MVFFLAFIEQFACTSYAQTGTSPVKSSNVDRLIKDLANDDFQIRQDAESHLVEMGSPIVDRLQSHLGEGDNEIRMRIKRIVGLIHRDRLNKLIDGFVARKNPLPGWNVYSASMGRDESARDKYASLFRSRHKYLEQLAAPGDGLDLLKETLVEIEKVGARRATFDSELMACFSIQVIHTLPAISSDQQFSRVREPLSRYFSRTAITEISNKRNSLAPLHRAAAVAWLNLNDPDPFELNRRVQVACRLSLPEGVGPAVKSMELEGRLPSGTIRNAMTLIARYGEPSQISLLMKYLDNPLLLHTGRQVFQFKDIVKNEEGPDIQKKQAPTNVIFTTQVGDLALSSMIHLAGLRHEDFGLNVGKQSYNEPVLPVRLSGFANEQDRKTAHEKWKIYFKENLNEVLPNTSK